MTRQRAYSEAYSLQTSGSGTHGVRPPMPSDEDISRGGVAARRRYLMRYVAGAVAISAAICVAAGVRAATKRAAAEGPADVSLRPAIVRTVEPTAPARAVEPTPAHSTAVDDAVSVASPPPPPALPKAHAPPAAVPRPPATPTQKPTPRRDRGATILHEAPY
jgi:hypothetical protein